MESDCGFYISNSYFCITGSEQLVNESTADVN